MEEHQSQCKESNSTYSAEIPHEYYLALVWDPVTKEISQKSSPIFDNCINNVFEQAVPKLSYFSQAAAKRKFVDRVHCTAMDCMTEGVKSLTEPERKRFCRGKDIEPRSPSDYSELSQSQPSYKQSAHYEHHGDPFKGQRQVTYRADSRKEWEMWFADAFRAVQQLSCRAIAKEWIRTVHPTKQRTHPYNGKNPKSKQWEGSDATRPPYWPIDVVHKEPDHILKEERITLLVHLLMNTPHQEISVLEGNRSAKKITAKTLKQSLGPKIRESQHGELLKKWKIVEHIIDIRMKLEQQEKSTSGGCVMITAPDFSKPRRRRKGQTSVREASRSSSATDDEEESEDVAEAIDGSFPGAGYTMPPDSTFSPQSGLDLKKTTAKETDGILSSQNCGTIAQHSNVIQQFPSNLIFNTQPASYLEVVAGRPQLSILNGSSVCGPDIALGTVGNTPVYQQPSGSSHAHLAHLPRIQPELDFQPENAIAFAIEQPQLLPLTMSSTESSENGILVQPTWNSDILSKTINLPSLTQQQQNEQPSDDLIGDNVVQTTWQNSCEMSFTQQAGMSAITWYGLCPDIGVPEDILCPFDISHPPLVLNGDLNAVEKDYNDYCQRVFANA